MERIVDRIKTKKISFHCFAINWLDDLFHIPLFLFCSSMSEQLKKVSGEHLFLICTCMQLLMKTLFFSFFRKPQKKKSRTAKRLLMRRWLRMVRVWKKRSIIRTRLSHTLLRFSCFFACRRASPWSLTKEANQLKDRHHLSTKRSIYLSSECLRAPRKKIRRYEAVFEENCELTWG